MNLTETNTMLKKMAALSKILVSLLLLLNLGGCGKNISYVRFDPKEMTSVKTLAVVVGGDQEYMYIDKVTDEHFGATLAFGLLGNAVAHSIAQGSDATNAELIMQNKQNLSVNKTFTDSLLQELINMKLFEKVEFLYKEPGMSHGYDALLNCDIKRYGMRTQQGGSESLIAFVDIGVNLKDNKDKIIIDDFQTVIADYKQNLEFYKANNNITKRDLEAIFVQAGKRVARLFTIK